MCSIARHFFPKSGREQYHLRKEIMQLNLSLFGRDANNMEIGLALTMPDRLVEKDKKEQVVIPVVKDIPAEAETSPVVTRQSTVPAPVEEPFGAKREDEMLEAKPVQQRAERVSRTSDQYASIFALNFGYSFGGDDALIASGGHDVSFGSGAHLRLSYDGLWNNRQGYRLALGYQFDKVTAGSDSGQLEQTYLQTLYLYNFRNAVVGIGLSLHTGIVFESDISSVQTTADFDDTSGVMVMYEHNRLFGDNIFGISHTVADSKNSSSQVEVDISRTEIYYRWQF